MEVQDNRYLHLGASLYVPATRGDLVEIGNREKHKGLRSVIFCTEDAVLTDDVSQALDILENALPLMQASPGLLRFIRVRNPHVMGRVLQMRGISKIDGFVLPKITTANLGNYLDQISGHDSPFVVMPTLETAEVFDAVEMRRLREYMSDSAVRPRILALRIGGNDLFNLLGVRRPPSRTIYETVIGHTIAMLVSTFKPHGFNLTAPVCEAIDCLKVLEREVVQDLDHGLFGKTAIHPQQAKMIESLYAVRNEDVDMAREILRSDAPAVFKMHGTMCEPATHRKAAQTLLERAALYGVTVGLSVHEGEFDIGAGPRLFVSA
ncbi:HpcH/HpaI aldolase/citrate lyase family protein [Niveispirillum sp. BGYR6]|uniref:HpcH/HpaI aldolase/citrate lyase family protein n=1 Tax=Niveispirillum sp. BGYR6 TaxID=2971249 RepID=UPI0022B94B3C|nr:HpcH/HpaI aldolase/citrate lyase family protein [Niveispirillum sp. BGYR6]MDG5496032.1 HpcH/HpaI aldolase/citrate lyase family protein [Niveispirillum sp. BGYR6]